MSTVSRHSSSESPIPTEPVNPLKSTGRTEGFLKKKITHIAGYFPIVGIVTGATRTIFHSIQIWEERNELDRHTGKHVVHMLRGIGEISTIIGVGYLIVPTIDIGKWIYKKHTSKKSEPVTRASTTKSSSESHASQKSASKSTDSSSHDLSLTSPDDSGKKPTSTEKSSPKSHASQKPVPESKNSSSKESSRTSGKNQKTSTEKSSSELHASQKPVPESKNSRSKESSRSSGKNQKTSTEKSSSKSQASEKTASKSKNSSSHDSSLTSSDGSDKNQKTNTQEPFIEPEENLATFIRPPKEDGQTGCHREKEDFSKSISTENVLQIAENFGTATDSETEEELDSPLTSLNPETILTSYPSSQKEEEHISLPEPSAELNEHEILPSLEEDKFSINHVIKYKAWKLKNKLQKRIHYRNGLTSNNVRDGMVILTKKEVLLFPTLYNIEELAKSPINEAVYPLNFRESNILYRTAITYKNQIIKNRGENFFYKLRFDEGLSVVVREELKKAKEMDDFLNAFLAGKEPIMEKFWVHKIPIMEELDELIYNCGNNKIFKTHRILCGKDPLQAEISMLNLLSHLRNKYPNQGRSLTLHPDPLPLFLNLWNIDIKSLESPAGLLAFRKKCDAHLERLPYLIRQQIEIFENTFEEEVRQACISINDESITPSSHVEYYCEKPRSFLTMILKKLEENDQAVMSIASAFIKYIIEKEPKEKKLNKTRNIFMNAIKVALLDVKSAEAQIGDFGLKGYLGILQGAAETFFQPENLPAKTLIYSLLSGEKINKKAAVNTLKSYFFHFEKIYFSDPNNCRQFIEQIKSTELIIEHRKNKKKSQASAGKKGLGSIAQSVGSSFLGAKVIESIARSKIINMLTENILACKRDKQEQRDSIDPSKVDPKRLSYSHFARSKKGELAAEFKEKELGPFLLSVIKNHKLAPIIKAGIFAIFTVKPILDNFSKELVDEWEIEEQKPEDQRKGFLEYKAFEILHKALDDGWFSSGLLSEAVGHIEAIREELASSPLEKNVLEAFGKTLKSIDSSKIEKEHLIEHALTMLWKNLLSAVA